MTYPGGKGTCFQQIINRMPPHTAYIEAFLGAGSVMRHKKPARVNYGFDLDPAALAAFVETTRYDEEDQPHYRFECVDAVRTLPTLPLAQQPDTLIYCDPPYLMSSRRRQRDLYRYEMGTEEEHAELVTLLRALPCMVMLSGYWSDLYASMLYDWKYVTFQVMTRGGTMADEYLWMNFPAPTALHDYAFLGDNYRERERIKRKTRRWVERLQAMPMLERQALLSAMEVLR